MATLVRVPEVAAGATEVVVSEWLVDVGGEVAAGAPVATLETDKALVELEAEASGVLLHRLVDTGASVQVGAPLLVIGSTAETTADIEALLSSLNASSPAEAADEQPTSESTRDSTNRIFATPLSRRLLAEAGIGLQEVTGTGPNGRITKKDAEQARARATGKTSHTSPPEADRHAPEDPPPSATGDRRQASPPQAQAGRGFTEIEHSRIRRAIASRLTASKQTIPHFYVRRTARVDDLLRLRAELNQASTQRISVNDMVIRAVAIAHRQVPEANVVWTDASTRRFEDVDVGVAIASEKGLVTPVLRSIQDITPSGIARRVQQFVDQASSGNLAQRDLDGGSITVTNLGMYGVEEFAAIINPPQSAILAVGAATEQPVVSDGAIKIATVMNLVMSVDHRAIDGALAARWMAVLVSALEQPMQLVR